MGALPQSSQKSGCRDPEQSVVGWGLGPGPAPEDPGHDFRAQEAVPGQLLGPTVGGGSLLRVLLMGGTRHHPPPGGSDSVLPGPGEVGPSPATPAGVPARSLPSLPARGPCRMAAGERRAGASRAPGLPTHSPAPVDLLGAWPARGQPGRPGLLCPPGGGCTRDVGRQGPSWHPLKVEPPVLGAQARSLVLRGTGRWGG